MIKNLFTFVKVPTNNIMSMNFVYNININLWHARFGHYNNNNNNNIKKICY